MVKLLICLFSGAALGIFMLQLRQQQMELSHQTAEIHDQIKSQQSKLWNQQLQIAVYTAPNAIDNTIRGQNIDMVPEYSTDRKSWIESSSDAE